MHGFGALRHPGSMPQYMKRRRLQCVTMVDPGVRHVRLLLHGLPCQNIPPTVRRPSHVIVREGLVEMMLSFRSPQKRRRVYKYPQIHKTTSRRYFESLKQVLAIFFLAAPARSALGKFNFDVAMLEIFQKRPESAVEPHVVSNDSPHYTLCDLDWYPGWLAHQLMRVPPSFLDVQYNEDSDGDSTEPKDPQFLKAFAAVNEYVYRGESCGIDESVEQLIAHQLRVSQKTAPDRVLHQRYLGFSILAWESMLFLPSLDFFLLNKFAIHQDVNQLNSGLYVTYFKCRWIQPIGQAILLGGLRNFLPS